VEFALLRQALFPSVRFFSGVAVGAWFSAAPFGVRVAPTFTERKCTNYRARKAGAPPSVNAIDSKRLLMQNTCANYDILKPVPRSFTHSHYEWPPSTRMLRQFL
jgi:hypothetical protein